MQKFSFFIFSWLVFGNFFLKPCCSNLSVRERLQSSKDLKQLDALQFMSIALIQKFENQIRLILQEEEAEDREILYNESIVDITILSLKQDIFCLEALFRENLHEIFLNTLLILKRIKAQECSNNSTPLNSERTSRQLSPVPELSAQLSK